MAKKNKDPAFLFYSSDFLSGVCAMTMLERGQYITLLCSQHQQGHLSEKQICVILGIKSISKIPEIMSKFAQDENGLYYNIKLDTELERRMAYTESRKASAMARWQQK